MSKSPCKDCKERHSKCWGHCEQYKEWKANNVKPYARDEASEFLIKSIEKQKRRK